VDAEQRRDAAVEVMPGGVELAGISRLARGAEPTGRLDEIAAV
jgi:hypothetical protein